MANKKDLIYEIYKSTGVSREQARDLLDGMAEGIAEFISHGAVVRVDGLGSFQASENGRYVRFVPCNALLSKCIANQPGWALEERLRRQRAEDDRRRANGLPPIERLSENGSTPVP